MLRNQKLLRGRDVVPKLQGGVMVRAKGCQNQLSAHRLSLARNIQGVALKPGNNLEQMPCPLSVGQKKSANQQEKWESALPLTQDLLRQPQEEKPMPTCPLPGAASWGPNLVTRSIFWWYLGQCYPRNSQRFLRNHRDLLGKRPFAIRSGYQPLSRRFGICSCW
jgi:hypothetical protein